MATNYINDFYKQFEEISEKLDKANNTIHTMSIDMSLLRNELKESNNLNVKYLNEINELKLEIERLKNNNKKDSSNSSKPSSTNGYKKTIINNREKSSNKKGGQKGHQGKTLTNEEIEKMIKNNEVDEIIVIEENKNEHNKDLKPIIQYEYDIELKRIVKKHIIYPDKPLNIKKAPVIYGNNVKAINCLLNQKYMSLDGIQSFIYDTVGNHLKISKGSLCSWNDNIANLFLTNEYEYIKEQLMNSLVVNVDESPIKINGEQYYLHNISDGYHTLQYVTKHRSSEDIDDFGFLKAYKGVIVHDHYKMYYNYGIDNGECNAHVLRYLNAVTEFTNHNWAKNLKDLLLKMKTTKEQLIKEKKDKISDEEFNRFKGEYLKILNEGKKERLKDLNTNAYKKDELCLLNRLIKYADNHLLFLKKFFVPFSNNRAETDLRGIKIKQKTGKFRSLEGATNYAITRSCLSTYKKNNINLYYALIKLLNKKPILV